MNAGASVNTETKRQIL